VYVGQHLGYTLRIGDVLGNNVFFAFYHNVLFYLLPRLNVIILFVLHLYFIVVGCLTCSDGLVF
jgi:hypothetical protein